MDITALSTLVTLILAVSLAAERLVAILKTAVPQLRSAENNSLAAKAGEGKKDPGMAGDRMRPLIVMGIAFAASWVTSAFLTGGDFNLFGKIPFGSADNPAEIPVLIMALLASGGSEFWKNILGYTKALRDIKIGDRANGAR